MKRYRYIIILFIIHSLSINNVFSSDRKYFYDVVFSYEAIHSYYISLQVKSEKYTGYVIIENSNLYWYISKTMGLNKEDYKIYIEKILENKEYLNIKEEDFEQYSFIKIVKNNKIEKQIAKNKLRFIQTNFNLVKESMMVPYFYLYGHDEKEEEEDKDEDRDKLYEIIDVYYVFKRQLSEEERNYMIHKLFYMEWSVIRDCESGIYMIHNCSNNVPHGEKH